MMVMIIIAVMVMVWSRVIEANDGIGKAMLVSVNKHCGVTMCTLHCYMKTNTAGS